MLRSVVQTTPIDLQLMHALTHWMPDITKTSKVSPDPCHTKVAFSYHYGLHQNPLGFCQGVARSGMGWIESEEGRLKVVETAVRARRRGRDRFNTQSHMQRCTGRNCVFKKATQNEYSTASNRWQEKPGSLLCGHGATIKRV